MRALVLHQAMVCDLRDAALRLMKVNGDLPDNNLRNALILEQAGQLYHASGSPRKGAFHLVLAGHTYNKLGFKRLALFTYQAVVDLYLGKGWQGHPMPSSTFGGTEGTRQAAVSFSFGGLVASFA
ncbi:unnamed protein product [Effrenium voratum]|nr:unnamed protein product [Effrenium voratum]